ncbi:MAG: DUF4382 domain-containing protein [Phycisphaerae bacterium]
MSFRRATINGLVLASIALSAFAVVGASGCAELQSLLGALLTPDPNNADPNNDPNEPNDPNDDDGPTARAVFFIQGREIDGFAALNVTVSEVSFVGGGNDDNNENDNGDDDKDDDDAKSVSLSPNVRINLLTADAAEFITCSDDAPVGEYTKLRLTISDPQFIQTNGTVIDGADIRLTGNGKLDLNTQGGKFNIEEGIANFIVFTLQAGDNAVKVTETGNGVFNLRSEAFVDAGDVQDVDIVMAGVVTTNNESGALVIAAPECEFAVIIVANTQISLPDGGVGTVGDIDVGEAITIVGVANDDDSTIIAASITILN